MLAGLDSDTDRQAFRALLQQLAVHAATALDLDACNAERHVGRCPRRLLAPPAFTRAPLLTYPVAVGRGR